MKRKFLVKIKKLFLLFYFFICLWMNIQCTADRNFLSNYQQSKHIICQETLYYIEDICEDEIELLKWASSEYMEYSSLQLLDMDTLQNIAKKESSIDRATAIFYHRAIQDPNTKKLLDYILLQEKQMSHKKPDYTQHRYLFLVVPGMFYEDNQEVDASGKKLRDIAKEIGMQESFIPIKQTGTIEENAIIICSYIQESQNYNGIILASTSKGSSDLKIAIQICGKEPYFQKVIGWLNIGGINKGSLIVDAMSNDFLPYMEGRFYFWMNDYNWNGLLSIRKLDNPKLTNDLKIPRWITAINIVGIPISSMITNRAKPFYNYLSKYGPNEGINLLADSFMEDAYLYPAWRNDHYFRSPFSKTKIMALISFIIEEYKMKSSI